MTDARFPDWPKISEALREKAKELCRDLAVDLNPSIEGLVLTALRAAHFDAYRDEFKAKVEAKGAWAELEVAKQVMRGEGFTDEMLDLVCGIPGFKAPVATMADGKEAVCVEYMAGLNPRPLSAYFLERVREAIEISARVGALEMLKAEGKGDVAAVQGVEKEAAAESADAQTGFAFGDAAG
jgi:hypothetical protein